jgi:hypothetical protein
MKSAALASVCQTIRLLLIISTALGTFSVVLPVRADAGGRTLEDGLRLMSVSQTILAGEFEEEMEYARGMSVMALVGWPQTASVDDQLLEAMINSVKFQIAILIKECNATRGVLEGRNEECAVSTLDALCEEGKAELRSTLSLLRQIRGDKRKLFTRLGDSVRRTGQRIWHAVGPVGRRILRALGDEVVQAVKSPGGLEFKALRVIIRSRLKSLARTELRNAIQRGVERQVLMNWEVARGPTGDQCLGVGEDQAAVSTEEMAAIQELEDRIYECVGDKGLVEYYRSGESATMVFNSATMDFPIAVSFASNTIDLHYEYKTDVSHATIRGRDGVIIGWNRITMHGVGEASGVFDRSSGIFFLTFDDTRISTDTSQAAPWEKVFTHNVFGILSDDYATIQVCDGLVYAPPSKEALITVKPEAFKEYCAWKHYYLCASGTP